MRCFGGKDATNWRRRRASIGSPGVIADRGLRHRFQADLRRQPLTAARSRYSDYSAPRRSQ